MTARARIEKPGIYRIPLALYHDDCAAGPSISSSGLRTIFLKSPAHYFICSYLNQNRTMEAVALPKVLGSAAHHLLLGEDDFSTMFVARPPKLGGAPWQGNRTACKQWLADQESAGRTVLLHAQLDQVRGMARNLADHPLVKAGILNGRVECSMIWRDEETGVWLKARPDAIPTDSGDFADLKTTSRHGFDLDRQVSELRYDMQAALVKWAARAVLGLAMESFSFVFVGSEPPHCVDVLTLDKPEIEAAEADLRVAVNVFAQCVQTGKWFGPAGTQNDARYVYISEWARKSAENRRAFLARELREPEEQSAQWTA